MSRVSSSFCCHVREHLHCQKTQAELLKGERLWYLVYSNGYTIYSFTVIIIKWKICVYMCESECVRETDGKIKRQIRASANDTKC